MESIESDNPCECLWYVHVILTLIGAYKILRAFKSTLNVLLSELKGVDLAKYGRGSWAIITGATDGIGKAFAEELAERGFNIYQISRNPDKLNACQAELTGKYGVLVHSLVWDFNNTSTSLKEFIELVNKDIEGKDVSILINNVGISFRGFFHLQSVTKVNEVLTVNCLPTTYLTRLVLPQMHHRKLPCAVINLSSVRSIVPFGGSATYSSSKKFDDYLTTNLANQPSNVTFMSLRPGFTETTMTSTHKGKPMLITSNACAKAALRDLGSDISFVGHLKHKLKAAFIELLPEFIPVRWSMGQTLGKDISKYSNLIC